MVLNLPSLNQCDLNVITQKSLPVSKIERSRNYYQTLDNIANVAYVQVKINFMYFLSDFYHVLI